MAENGDRKEANAIRVVSERTIADIAKMKDEVKRIYLYVPPQFKGRVLSEIAQGIGVKPNTTSPAAALNDEMERAAQIVIKRAVRRINKGAEKLGPNTKSEFLKRVFTEITSEIEPEGSIFSPRLDLKVVTQYLKDKTQKAFPNGQVSVKAEKAKNSELGKYKFAVQVINEPPVTVAEVYNFIHDDLETVFEGVNKKDFSLKDTKVFNFSVVGTPARLIGDIRRKDPANLPEIETSRKNWLG